MTPTSAQPARVPIPPLRAVCAVCTQALPREVDVVTDDRWHETMIRVPYVLLATGDMLETLCPRCAPKAYEPQVVALRQFLNDELQFAR